MTTFPDALVAHLSEGATTLCRCWRLVRRDGRVFAFTDHDEVLAFDGTAFAPTDALSARALEQTTGLAVDNSEAMGALSDAGLTEGDILAGRFDGARVEIWRVNWADPAQRILVFRGRIGEIERTDGAFRAELRGLTEMLNQPQGRLYQRQCRAVLGDAECGVDLSDSLYRVEFALPAAPEGARFAVPAMEQADGWFDRGTLTILDGSAAGLTRAVKADRILGDGRRIELWESLPPAAVRGTRVRIEAGCDKRIGTCRRKFDNVVNFRGFPFLPDEDWLTAYPRREGGS